MPLTPLLKRLTDIGLILAVSAVVAFIIIAGGTSLVQKATLAKSWGLWFSFITRPDIIVTTILAIIVTMAVGHYNASNRR